MRIFKKTFFTLILTFLIFSLPFLIPKVFGFIKMGDGSNSGGYGAGKGTDNSGMPIFSAPKGPTSALKATTGVDANADEFELIGDNLVAKGNVFVRKGDLLVYSDMAIINNVTKNIELSGNVRFLTLVSTRNELEYWELKDMQKDPFTKLKVVGTVLTPSGRQKLVVDIIKEELAWSGDRAAGNLKTGIFEFSNFVSKFGNWYALGDNGKRYGDGKIVIEDATITPCQDILEGHSVYSFESAKLVAFPPASSSSKKGKAMQGGGDDLNSYHFWGYSNILYIGNIPVLWLPVVYKPPRGDEGQWGIEVGSNSDWGYYALTTNYWNIIDDSDVSLGLTNFIDYYGKRGFALGNQTELYTKDTQTEFFVYGLHDRDANINVPDYSRFGDLNPLRYALQLKNITNITDRLSFRGSVSKLSDMYFLYDFFNGIAKVNPQPATYGSLDYQFDNASVNLMIRPRVNNFFSVVEALPRLGMSAPRQELFENLYFQSETSVGYYQMKWRDFDISRSDAFGIPANQNGPADYGTARFDTVNFMYYPINLDWVNILPRAGLRVTAYGDSSKTAVSNSDLEKMISADNPEGQYSGNITNYESGGGGKFRLVPEFGVQFNTKISRSWNEVKNAYFDFNGMRHVVEPYINYTFIGNPTVSRDNLFYFDDVDRIDSQNWVRLGVENRLQTRRGSWGGSQVYTWASMENFVDLIFMDNGNQGDGLKNLGGIGTTLRLTPSENLAFTMEFLADGSKITSFSNLLGAVDKASFGVNWEFAENWGISGTYYFGNAGASQGIYSMGSSMTNIQSGSTFLRNFTNSSYINTTLDYQINERTAGFIALEYDFYQNLMPNLKFGFIRALPCGLDLELALNFEKQNNTSNDGYLLKTGFSGSLVFSSSSDYIISPRENLLPENIERTPF